MCFLVKNMFLRFVLIDWSGVLVFLFSLHFNGVFGQRMNTYSLL